MGIKCKEVSDYFASYGVEKEKRLESIRNIIHDIVPDIKEKMWTKVPCFYIDRTTIVIRVFNDHINIFVDEVFQYKDELLEYKITPKGALQVFDNQVIPFETLSKIFRACFTSMY